MSLIRGLFGKAASLLQLGRPRPGEPVPPGPPRARPRPRRRPRAPSGTVESIGRGAHAIRVEYTPSLDGDPDPGEVVWTWVPYEDEPARGKDRPVVVIGSRRGTLVGVPLTSKRTDRSPQVPIGTGAWDAERRPSFANVDRIIELNRAAVRREGAILARDRFDALLAGVRRQLES